VRPGPPLLYLATAGGLALTAHSLAGHPLPLPWALGAMASYLGVVGLGAALPRLEMWGDVLWRVPGGRGVALTFDHGPHPVHTLAIATALQKRSAAATFFQTGEKAERMPHVARALCEAGHEVGIHAFHDDRWLALRRLGTVRDELRRAVEALDRATGRRPLLFRPPGGLLNPRIARACDELELEIVGWSGQALDGRPGAPPAQLAARASRALRDGAIVRLSDDAGQGDQAPQVLAALPEIMAALDARNLCCVGVTALVASAPEDA
jgi:peptidoglycan-N-acetylglucosamine deacetylase